MDLNNLTYTPVKSTLPRMTYIPVGNYFAGFRKSQSAGTGSVYIFKKELDLPGQPLFVLRTLICMKYIHSEGIINKLMRF